MNGSTNNHVVQKKGRKIKIKIYFITETLVEIPIHLLDDSQVSYVTPYQLINYLNLNPKCQNVAYRKPASQTLNPKDFSLINLLKESPAITTTSKKVQAMKRRDREALWFMRGIMDECTHLKNFTVPYDTSLIISICAKYDGYVPRVGVSTLEDIWPGATVKYVECGHVGAYVWHRNIFRSVNVTLNHKIKILNRIKPTKKPLIDPWIRICTNKVSNFLIFWLTLLTHHLN